MPKPDCTVLVVKGSTQAEDYAGWLAAEQARSYRVLTADCSANAIPKLTLPAGLKVDGVLLTLSTSHRDSAALIGQLKAQLASACPPIIVIGDRDMTAAVTALKAGAADYLGQDQLTATQLTTALSAAIALTPPAAIRAAHPQHPPQAALNNRQDLVEVIPQIIWTADAQGQVNYWNRRWFDYTGSQPTESMGWNALQQVHPDDRDRTLTAWQTALALGHPFESEYRIQRHDGVYRWFICRALPTVTATGQIAGWAGTITDIDQRVQLEQALVRERDSRQQTETALASTEEWYRYIFEAVDVAIWEEDFSLVKAQIEQLKQAGVTDFRHYCNEHPDYVQQAIAQVKPVNVNQAALRMFKAKHKADLLISLDRVFVTETQPSFVDELVAIAAGDRRLAIETIGQTLTGERMQVQVNITFPTASESYERVLVCVVDQTEQKAAETALRQGEERFRTLADNIAQLTWMADVSGCMLWFNQRWFDYTGTTLAQMDESGWREVHHPDYVERVLAKLQQCFQSGEPWEDTFPLRGRDGQYRWFLARALPIRDEAGNIWQWFGSHTDITQRKQAEDALKASEERLQMALEASGSGFWDWDIVADRDYLSPQWLAMLGFKPGELEEKYNTWAELIHPEDKPQILERLQAHLQDSAVPYSFEYRLATKQGDWKWIANYGKVVARDDQGNPLRMMGIHHDVSDRKRIEAILRLSESRYRTLANAVPQLMWIDDATGKTEFFNQRWQTYVGQPDLSLDHALGTELMHAEDVSEVLSKRATALQTGRDYEIECRLQRHDGAYRWHLVRVVPLNNGAGQPVSWFGTATDIHDRKAAAGEREQLLRREKNAREEAERANRIKDEFLAILSHELRSPLNPILGWSRLLQTHEFDADRTAEALATIERNAQLQTQLIDDLLDIAKILRGKLKLQKAAVDLASAMTEAIATMAIAASAKAIIVKSEIVDTAQIWGDPGRLQQIIWNLLSNAIKFTPAGGQIDLRLQQDDRDAVMTVQDTGKGINADFLPNIFKSFHQEDASITRQHGGLGLGLAIVRYLVEAHGGQITVDSPGENQGSTFTLRLPLLPQATVTTTTQRSPATDLDLTGIRVLAIDDNPDTCELLETLLSQYGAEIAVVTAAAEGLSRVSTFQPDVLISDIGMPDIDGFTLIEQIRQLPATAGGQTPAIALTAYIRESDRQRTYASGYQAHLAKPVDVDRLLLTVIALSQEARDR